MTLGGYFEIGSQLGNRLLNVTIINRLLICYTYMHCFLSDTTSIATIVRFGYVSVDTNYYIQV